MTRRSKMLCVAAFFAWLAIGLFMAANQGCATKYVSDTGRELPPGLGYAVQTLEAGKTVYDSVLTVAGTLHCDKKISDETAWKIVKAANAYYLTHNAAQLAVDGWARAIEVKGDTETAKSVAFAQLSGLAKSALALVRDVKTLTGKGIELPDMLTEQSVNLVFGR